MKDNQTHAFGSGLTALEVNGMPVKALVAKPGNVTSLRLKKAISDLESSSSAANIDYCSSAVDLLCAVEEIYYDILFIDYTLENIDLCALLKFLSIHCPETKVIVTSAPVWNTTKEKKKITGLCSTCCHEDFYDLDLSSCLTKTNPIRQSC